MIGWKEQLQPEILTNDGYKMLLCEVGKKHKLVLNGHVDVVSGKRTIHSQN